MRLRVSNAKVVQDLAFAQALILSASGRETSSGYTFENARVDELAKLRGSSDSLSGNVFSGSFQAGGLQSLPELAEARDSLLATIDYLLQIGVE